MCVWAGLGEGGTTRRRHGLPEKPLQTRSQLDANTSDRVAQTPSMLRSFVLCLLAAASHALLITPAAQLRVVARSATSPVVMQEGEPKKGNCVRATPFFYK